MTQPAILKTRPLLRGLLPVHKPEGMISKDVSRFLLKLLGKGLKLGHVGTLDPMASGVLPILLGSATKLQDYLLNSTKIYEFEVTFGYETDSLDATGQVVTKESTDHLSEDLIFTVSQKFLGELEQEPPIYSAVKFQGQPLYQYAKSERSAAVPLENLKRKVFIETLDILDLTLPRATFRVCCGKGTYVRSLARDLALALKTRGTITKLKRTCTAGVHLKNCLSLEQIEAHSEHLEEFLLPIEAFDIQAQRWHCLTSDMVLKLNQGQDLILSQDQFTQGFADKIPKDNLELAGTTNEGKNKLFLFDLDNKAFGIAQFSYLDFGAFVKLHLQRGL